MVTKPRFLIVCPTNASRRTLTWPSLPMIHSPLNKTGRPGGVEQSGSRPMTSFGAFSLIKYQGLQNRCNYFTIQVAKLISPVGIIGPNQDAQDPDNHQQQHCLGIL